MLNPGVLLLNLGSPDSPSVSDVRKYLDQFLMDERVIDYPDWQRSLIVKGLILPTRPKNTAEAYEKIWTEQGSPLVVTSKAQRDLLQKKLDIPVALGMRYGNPSTSSAVESLIQKGVDDFLIFPLYPHYAMSSFETAYQEAIKAIRKWLPQAQTLLMPPFYREAGYIQAMAASIEPYIKDGDFDRLIFSFHGIPERHLCKTDPSKGHCLSENCCLTPHPAHHTCYKHQCVITTHLLIQTLGIPKEKCLQTFQSRLGRSPWLQPYSDQVIDQLAEDGIKKIRVVCPSFVTDCLETLEEIGMTAKESFESKGGTELKLIPCLNENPIWIDYLAQRVTQSLAGRYPQPAPSGQTDAKDQPDEKQVEAAAN